MRIRYRLLLLLVEHELLEQVGEVLASVLLLAGLKLFMALANQSFKDGWPNTILIELIFLFLSGRCFVFFLIIHVNFLGDLFLRVLA